MGSMHSYYRKNMTQTNEKKKKRNAPFKESLQKTEENF